LQCIYEIEERVKAKNDSFFIPLKQEKKNSQNNSLRLQLGLTTIFF